MDAANAKQEAISEEPAGSTNFVINVALSDPPSYNETQEEVRTKLFIEQDAQYMILKSFLKKADPSLLYNEPIRQLLVSFFLPLLGSFLWLCIPLTGSPTLKFFLFAFIFQPVMALLHCILLWYLLSLYLPTPATRTKVFSVLLSLGVNLLILLNLLWTEQFFHGSRILLVLALFGICIPIFLVAYFHCQTVMELGKLGKSDVLGAQAIKKATDELAGETQPILLEKTTELNWLQELFSRVPNDSVLVPWKPASLKKRSWSMFIGIIFDIGIYSFLIVLSLLVFANQQDGTIQIILAIAMYIIETGTHKLSSLVSTRLDEDLCFEIPQFVLHSFFIDLIFYSYNRNALFLSVTSYDTFAWWQVVHVIDDTYAGLLTYFSYKFAKVPLLGKCSIPNLEEFKEVLCVQYFGKKQAQLFSNTAFLAFMFLLKYYWNRDLFPYEEEEHMDMLVVYSISMYVVDIFTAAITFYFIQKDLAQYNKTIQQLVKDFYSYPKVGAIVSLLSILSLQYTFTSIFFTQNL